MKKKTEKKLHLGKVKIAALSKSHQQQIHGGMRPIYPRPETVYPECQVTVANQLA